MTWREHLLIRATYFTWGSFLSTFKTALNYQSC